jgi:hypothetical protein
MRLRRYRFAIGQLLKSIAILAVLFAVLRTPFWPLVLAIGLVLTGFTVDRTRGGHGINGGMIARGIGFPVIVFAGGISILLFARPKDLDLPGFLVLIFGGAVVGWSVGAVVGCWACMIVNSFGGPARARPALGESIGWIDKHESDYQHSRDEGSPP